MENMESTLALAFGIGLFSACSLPLGAITTRFWTPSDRMTAILMAFGGGALLAALTIDLVASALSKGHVVPLIIGCILGGLLFRLLNEMISSKGGFLRKSSTVIHYLQRKERQRFRKALSRLRRTELFKNLPGDVSEELAGAVFTIEVKKGETLYRQHDPSERMYVIESGAIEMLNPLKEMACEQRLDADDAFGQMGFLTGTPRAMFAVAAEDTHLWMLPKGALLSALSSSTELADRVIDFVYSDAVRDYLRDHHGLSDDAVRRWQEHAFETIRRGEGLAEAMQVNRNSHSFLEAAGDVRRFPLFADLPEDELRAVADHLICKRHQRGDTLFYKNEPADRLYILDRGEVALLDPSDSARRPIRLGDHDAFGGFAFLTGAKHTVSAVVSRDDTTLWVLRKRDFEALLATCPHWGRKVREFLERDDIGQYLAKRQEFDAHRVSLWTRKAVKSLDGGRLIPSAAEMAKEVKAHGGAPIAIWLGIFLDGIPESLVIGASLLTGGVSYSLIAGLFLSNYPEALSSSVGMRQQGMSFTRVVLMWTSLMLITGVFSAVGNAFFDGAPPTLFSLIEGIAAGAMLTMIAETMMPEAYLKGGSVVGLSTLGGFLTAILFSAIGGGGGH